MRVNRSWLALGLGLSLAAPAEALAQTPKLHLSLDYRTSSAPPDCPNVEELRSALNNQVGYDPFLPGAPSPTRRLLVEIAASGNGDGTVARIVWLDSAGAVEGERTLASDSADCSELASGVVFAIAVQLQLLSAGLPEQEPAPATPPPASPEEARAERLAVLAGVGVFGQRGWQPGLAVGFRSFGALRGDWWSLILDAQATLPTTARFPARGGFSAREVAVGLAPCLRRAVLDFCALGRLGLVNVRGQGVDEPRAPSSPELLLGLRLQLVWPELARLATLAHLDVLAQLLPRDVWLNRERVWSTAPLAVALGVDVAALFK
jgi:hypothetical protein